MGATPTSDSKLFETEMNEFEVLFIIIIGGYGALGILTRIALEITK